MSVLTINLLLAYLLQSTAVAAVALAAERLLRPNDAASRRVLWALALIAGLAAPAWYLAWPGEAIALTGLPALVSVEALSRTTSAGFRIGAIWAVGAGALALAAWRVCGVIRLRRFAALATPFEPSAEIFDLEQRVGARADYRVSDVIEGPFTFGFGRPVIVLPSGFAEMAAEERTAILTHELLHVRRGDWLKLLGEEALRCLVWFTPAVYIILRRGRIAREMWTDALAVRVTRDRDSYLNALVTIARRPLTSDALVAPLFLEPRSLKIRVAALLEDHPMPKVHRIAAVTAIVLLLPLAGRWARDAFPSALRAAPAEVYKVGGDVLAPRLLTKVEPAYTDEASEAKLEGAVLLTIEVHPDGRAYNIQVVRGLGMGLDEQAVTAIEQWTFAPGTKDGKPVPVTASVEVNFKLE